MIRGSAMTAIVVMSKPRASGDDPTEDDKWDDEGG